MRVSRADASQGSNATTRSAQTSGGGTFWWQDLMPLFLGGGTYYIAPRNGDRNTCHLLMVSPWQRGAA